MDTSAYEQHQLPASFTFRIIEMLKQIKIHGGWDPSHPADNSGHIVDVYDPATAG